MLMRIPICLLSVSVVLVVAITAAVQPAYSFLEDPAVPILKVDELFRAEGSDSPPLILVYADGRVVKPVSKKS